MHKMCIITTEKCTVKNIFNSGTAWLKYNVFVDNSSLNEKMLKYCYLIIMFNCNIS